MSNTNNARGILHAIQLIASNHETGQLEIRSSRSHGSLSFSKGKLVDAKFGPLTGFQAVNAAVAVRAVDVSFNPWISPPRPGSIAPNERVVLKQFFGIEAADRTDEIESVDWNITPHQVVPIAEVESGEGVGAGEGAGAGAAGAGTGEGAESRSSLGETAFIRNETPEESTGQYEQQFVAGEASPETKTSRKPEPQSLISAQSFRFPLRRRVAVSLMLLLILAAAIALMPKLKGNREVVSVPPAQPSAIPQSTIPDVQKSKTETEREVEQVGSKASSTSVAQRQSQKVNSSAPSPAMATPQRAQSTQRDPHVQDLTGEWHIINTVDKSAYKSFQNLRVGFRLKIEQNGKDFTARGEKISENGRNLPARSRTPILVTGSVDGDKVIATFVEDGLRRRTNGRFDWKLQNEHDALKGTFISAAANSSGKSAATRQP
jgi:hypothetical protein